jgi:hypothetical protein
MFDKLWEYNNCCPLCEYFVTTFGELDVCSNCVLVQCRCANSIYGKWRCAINDEDRQKAANELITKVEAWETGRMTKRLVITTTIQCGELTCIDKGSGETCHYLLQDFVETYCGLFNQYVVEPTVEGNYMRRKECLEVEKC